MSESSKPTRKKFRVAVSGATVDGREIKPEHLRQAAANYDPSVYTARVNVEHYLSPLVTSEFGAMGDVAALSAEDIAEGALAGRTALYAEFNASPKMKAITDEGKKVFSSIELAPQFALNGQAYVVGLAMTDTPASLGTDRLEFATKSRQQVHAFSKQQGESSMFSTAIEAEVFELAEQRSDEGSKWFSRMKELLTKNHKTDGEQFSQVREVVEGVATSQAGLIDQFAELKSQRADDAKEIQKLTSELTDLKTTLAKQDASTFSRQPAQGGNSGVEQADY
ncbi:GPO family capsid scaffolding protein [Citrobacter freundii]|uniref:GPO family capsid scaffolding protein n=1 Tax=Citrobacter freundii TaxID=546 RepID=UPI0015E8F21F|nr:GPO family capsid scaffolding protein [Citrobacter freundii]QLX27404.1 GPO family capsid scaffolding protein [Citrobacter freundii]